MISVSLPTGRRATRVLCLGAHSDDIEIGCGGTLLKWIDSHEGTLDVTWVVFSAGAARGKEAVASARRFLRGAKSRIVVRTFRDGFFPYQGTAIKEAFERLKKTVSPDVIFTHYRNDLHQDHRLISELTWNTFRDHLVLEYEVPKYDGDLGAPNLFVHLDDSLCRRKIQNLIGGFPSQRNKAWFTEETFRALMRLRGMESNSPTRFAEAFYCRKLVWGAAG